MLPFCRKKKARKVFGGRERIMSVVFFTPGEWERGGELRGVQAKLGRAGSACGTELCAIQVWRKFRYFPSHHHNNSLLLSSLSCESTLFLREKRRKRLLWRGRGLFLVNFPVLLRHKGWYFERDVVELHPVLPQPVSWANPAMLVKVLQIQVGWPYPFPPTFL